MARTKKQSKKDPRPTKPEQVPPGATRQALDRPLDPGGGAPGSGAGPRHAAGDPGTEIEDTGNETARQVDMPSEEELVSREPSYAGPSGGAVGGTPAGGRSSGGRTHGGLAPGGDHRGDSTIGADPESGAD